MRKESGANGECARLHGLHDNSSRSDLSQKDNNKRMLIIAAKHFDDVLTPILDLERDKA